MSLTVIDKTSFSQVSIVSVITDPPFATVTTFIVTFLLYYKIICEETIIFNLI